MLKISPYLSFFSFICAVNLLEVKNLRVSYNQDGTSVEVLKGIDFQVPMDSIVGIVGESGSGKTVTAMSIMQLLDKKSLQSSGSINWHESNTTIDFLKLQEEEIRSYRGAKIGMVFQEPMSALNPILRCGFQVSEGLYAHHYGSKSQIKDRVLECFKLVGLTDLERVYNAYPFQLSGGQLQRVLIALAISCKPKLIIADEPTTALDVSLQRKILELLKQLKKELGLSILFISHDLNIVKELCDYAIVMNQGKIIEQGNIQKIFENPEQAYTKGLINCRPPLKRKIRKLLTIQDFETPQTSNNRDHENSFVSQFEIDKRLQSLELKKDLITVQKLNIRYTTGRTFFGKIKNEIHAVRDVSFTIKEGETLGLVGESGSGKSSIGRAILNLVKSSSEVIKYKELNLNTVSQSNWRPLRKDLQIIFQDPYGALNPKQIIGKALMEPMEVHSLYNNPKDRKDKAMNLLETVGLEVSHFNRYPHQFSGGQRQRICIARALSLEPKFIVCDEPVSALDVSIQAQILNLLVDLKNKFDLSYLFITHDLSVVNFIADRIAVMKDGEIIEYGNCNDIIHNPKTAYTQMLLASTPD
ncbi:MAG: ABC transporter ATP-binding protein [Saprospiraceae bacterium]